jgi:GntR family transcriptional regulator/MocR family aminotransferase
VAEWTPSLFLDPRSEDPVYLQIAHALMKEIHRGRFRPGDPLPGYRTLAEQLGVSRNTVMSAYRELQVEGWLVSAPGEGSAVSRRLPAHLPARLQSRYEMRLAAPGTMGFALGPEPPPPTAGARRGLLEVASGVPDPRLLPAAALARAYRRAIRTKGGPESGDPQGQPQLREALSRMLSNTRAISVLPERIFVARGSQMALFLVAQALVSTGDTIAVEALGARRAWDAFVRAGARCLPVPIDAEGLEVSALEALLRETPLRAVFLTPQRQYPTLAVLSAERRARRPTASRSSRWTPTPSSTSTVVRRRRWRRRTRRRWWCTWGRCPRSSAPTSGSASWSGRRRSLPG